MNTEQKQRALTALGMWRSCNDGSQREYQSAELIAALLQELIDAPELPADLVRDAALLDWLDAQSNGQGWLARESATGRGFRLHNNSSEAASLTVREAIIAAIEHDKQKGGA